MARVTVVQFLNEAAARGMARPLPFANATDCDAELRPVTRGA